MIDLWTLPLSLGIVKSGLSATLKYYYDLNIRWFYDKIFVAGVDIVMLLCVTFLGEFDDQRGLYLHCKSDGCVLVFFAASFIYCKN